MKIQLRQFRLATTLIGSCATAVSINLLHPHGAQAETIYRCGPDLKQYSQLPCDGGRSFEVDDRRNADQVQQAQTAAETHTKAARDLERSRQELDRNRPTFGSLSPRLEASATDGARKTKTSKSKTGKQTKKRGRSQPVDGAEYTAVDQTTLSKKPNGKADKASKAN